MWYDHFLFPYGPHMLLGHLDSCVFVSFILRIQEKSNTLSLLLQLPGFTYRPAQSLWCSLLRGIRSLAFRVEVFQWRGSVLCRQYCGSSVREAHHWFTLFTRAKAQPPSCYEYLNHQRKYAGIQYTWLPGEAVEVASHFYSLDQEETREWTSGSRIPCWITENLRNLAPDQFTMCSSKGQLYFLWIATFKQQSEFALPATAHETERWETRF